MVSNTASRGNFRIGLSSRSFESGYHPLDGGGFIPWKPYLNVLVSVFEILIIKSVASMTSLPAHLRRGVGAVDRQELATGSVWTSMLAVVVVVVGGCDAASPLFRPEYKIIVLLSGTPPVVVESLS